MGSTRGHLIRSLGMILAGMVSSRCTSICNEPGREAPRFTCYRSAPHKSCPAPSSQPLWGKLRVCWLDLSGPRLRSFEDTGYSQELCRRHAEALEALVAAGEVAAAVAEPLSAAFEEAVAHIERQQATCYIALPSEFIPRQDLMQQAALLEQMAAQAHVDPETVVQAQQALQRDMAWLARFHMGESPPPQGSEVDPASAEAARILVLLLVEGDE